MGVLCPSASGVEEGGRLLLSRAKGLADQKFSSIQHILELLGEFYSSVEITKRDLLTSMSVLNRFCIKFLSKEGLQKVVINHFSTMS